MKKTFFLFLFCAVLFSCSEDDVISNNSNGNTQEVNDPVHTVSDADFVLQNFGSLLTTNFSGIINDTDGNVLSGVQITIGSQTTITDQNGVFVINDASVYENFAHVTANKSGYIPASRAVVPIQNSINEIRITLLLKNTIATVTAGEASVVSLPNGAIVNFTGDFITLAGESYSGEVAVSIHYLPPNQAETFTQMPGMLYGKRSDGTATGMETYGMLSVNLYGANGELLNIDDNTPAILILPVDASTPNAPENMPMWYFDETLGFWKEDGFATKVGNNYVAEVTHFTWWNCDFPIDTVNACFQIKASQKLADFYFKIVKTETSQWVYTGHTNDSGEACGVFPKDEALTILVYGNCSNEVIYTQNIGPYSDDFTTTYNLSLPSEFAETTISVNVTDCEGNILSNGYGVLSNNINSNIEYIGITDGALTYTFVQCIEANYYLNIYELIDNNIHEYSDVILLDLELDNINVDLNTLCDIDSDGVNDYEDNCIFIPNPNQEDYNNNGTGDVCEDTDGDGIYDDVDNCINNPNPYQGDFNNNGIGDVCEDTDGDGINDDIDNCVSTVNTDQEDSNNNGIGDVCDTDVVTYELGDLIAGGVVFYIAPSPIDLDSDGIIDTGLVFSMYNITLTNWGCYSNDLPSLNNLFFDNDNPEIIPSGLGAEIGDGMNNTNAILNDCPDAPAAFAARSLGDKWFLPSAKELNLIFTNVSFPINISGVDTFDNSEYWSSSEIDLNLSISFNFGAGFPGYSPKNSSYYIRAVRAF